MRLALLGLPGAGKTTQAANIADTYDIPDISMGDLLRDERDAIIHYSPDNTERDGDLYFDAVGDVRRTAHPTVLPEYQETIGERLDRGEGPSATTAAYFLEDRLSEPDCEEGYAIDGFPRWREQAELMDGIDTLDMILYLDVSEDEIYDRLQDRGRDDDTEEAIQERIQWQRDGFEAVYDHYTDQKRPPITFIDADQSPDAVWQDIRHSIDSYIGVDT
jgi:adenylate kinase